MKLQFIRHATLSICLSDACLLVDPMFSEKEVNPPIKYSSNERRNPLVDLPIQIHSDWQQPDAVLVTHLHADHWDRKAAQTLSKKVPIFCQIGDETNDAFSGFQTVEPVREATCFKQIAIIRTGGQHGKGKIATQMGPVSGYVLKAKNEPSLYIAGDTIWCDEVKQALDKHKPDIIIVNAGAAQLIDSDPITMNADDVISICRYAPDSQIIAVHMEAINHCLLTRDQLRQSLEAEGLSHRVIIPEDGEWLKL